MTYEMTDKGISWSSDKQLYKTSKYKPEDVVPPPNWVNRYPGGYEKWGLPDLHDDEEFQVWMRLAGLPTFSKLALRNDTSTMKRGVYQVAIDTRMDWRIAAD